MSAMCLAQGVGWSPSPTFIPTCTLPLGHEGDHNFEERLAIREALIAAAKSRAPDPGPLTGGVITATCPHCGHEV